MTTGPLESRVYGSARPPRTVTAMETSQPAALRTRSSVARPSPVAGLSVAIVVGLAAGALTAYSQAWLSDTTTSLANSAGPWSVAAFLAARYNHRVATAVAASILTLTCCEVGYAIATEIRGGSNATSTVVFWLVAALLAGPPLGVAGAWSARRGLHRGVGFAVLAGVLIGEGLYGWTTVADTTDWRYWAFELLAGIVIALSAAARSAWPRHAIPAIATASLTAMVVFTFGRLA